MYGDRHSHLNRHTGMIHEQKIDLLKFQKVQVLFFSAN